MKEAIFDPMTQSIQYSPNEAATFSFLFTAEKDGLFRVSAECQLSETVQQAQTDFFTAAGIIAGCAVLILCAILLIFYYHKSRRIKRRFTKDYTWMSNPMVIACSLEFYQAPKNAEFKGYVDNLLGAKHDTLNLFELFYERMNYQFFPMVDVHPKTLWTKTELLDFIEKQAKLFASNLFDPINNINGFDGLICAISAHGIDQSILTSDYGLIKKKAIYRAFSDPYPAVRDLPRIFLFDCCDGMESIAKGIKPKKKTQTTGTMITKGDGDDKENKAVWKYGDNNTDWKLAVLNSSNLDYQSFLDTRFGSKMIYGFYSRAMACLDKGRSVYLGEIFGEIQLELGKTHQLPTFTWNNNTDHVVLKRNSKKVPNVETEMVTMTMTETAGHEETEDDGVN